MTLTESALAAQSLSAMHSQVLAGLAETFSVCAQGRSPEFILQVVRTADRLGMPKTLACCERHVAINASKSMRTEAFWEQIPACSSVRIARGLDAAYEEFKAHAVSKICPLIRNYNNHYGHSADMDNAQSIINNCELRVSVPPCKAFLKMAEPIASQAKAVAQS